MFMSPHTPPSLWQDSETEAAPSPPLVGGTSVDVAIVGGGLTGLSAALELARRGHRVTVIEARTLGFGGSGRNNGQVIPTLAAMEPEALIARHGETGERLVALVRDSASELFDTIRRENIACDAEQTGWFQPAHSPDYMRLSEKRVASWAAHGAPVDLLDRAAATRLIGSDLWHGGMLNSSGGHVDPLKLVRGMGAACLRAGVEIYENTPAQDMTRKGNFWHITTPEGHLRARAVLLATNAYSDAANTKVRRAMVPVTAWQLATPPLSAAQRAEILPGRQAVSDTRGDLWYFRYSADNRLVTGTAKILTPRRQCVYSHMARRLRTAFPQLAPVTFSHIWRGFVGITTDFAPKFYRLGPDCWSYTGYNGRGLALTVPVGRAFAGLIDGDDPADSPLPLSDPAPVPLHALVRRVARGRILLNRWRDRRPPKLG